MNDFRLNWTLPAQPLGEAIKPEKPVKVCEFREFETKAWPIRVKPGEHGYKPRAELAETVAKHLDELVQAVAEWIPADKRMPPRGALLRFGPHHFEEGGELDASYLKCLKDKRYVFDHLTYGNFLFAHDQGDDFIHNLGNARFLEWLEPISTSSDSDGWVAWSGGTRPVGSDVRVESRFRAGGVEAAPAGVWDWAHIGHSSDIVAYRILP